MNEIIEKYKQLLIGIVATALVSYTGVFASGIIELWKFPAKSSEVEAKQNSLINANTLRIDKCATIEDVLKKDSLLLVKVNNNVEIGKENNEAIQRIIANQNRMLGIIEGMNGRIKFGAQITNDITCEYSIENKE